MARKASVPAQVAPLDFRAELWAAADTLRGNMDAAEYKHVVLGLIFLKYASDAFDERRAELVKEAAADPEAGIDPDDRDEYIRRNVFFLPSEARWGHLRDNARSPQVGELIDAAMKCIEDENPKQLRGVLPRDYARPALDKVRLGSLIDRFSNVCLGGAEHQSRDTLGRVYEYFIERFASAEGRRGGEFYTPRCVVRLLVGMLRPKANTRLYDPCCGSGGLFVQSERFIADHGGRRLSASVYGQEMNHTTWRLCKMNLALRGIEADLKEGDSFRSPAHLDNRFDYVLANPPFNMSEWGGAALADDVRWQFGTPPAGNANYAWVQHFIHHLGPSGMAGFVMANGSLASNTSGEGDIRARIVQAGLVDCIVALPGQLFFTTQIPVCLWFLARAKGARPGEVLFLDARKLGVMSDRTHRDLTEEEMERLTATYHAWRDGGAYADVPGFCKSATLDEVKAHGWVLTPGRYVGAAETEEEDSEAFDERMGKLAATLKEQFAESRRLEEAIMDNLTRLGYGS